MGLCFPKSIEIGTKHDLPYTQILFHYWVTIIL